MEQELMITLGQIGAYLAMGIAAIGSAIAASNICAASIGAWKKCYQQDKPAPFLLLVLIGIPLSQTIYGMILMILVKAAASEHPTLWPLYLLVGILGGLAQALSSYYQSKAAAGAATAFAETGQGFTNMIMALGVVETTSIFALVFSIMLIS